MLVGTLSIRDLFDKNVHHLVPLFQRPYVWEQEDQWEPLWEDVRRLADALIKREPVRAHFLGASVHEKKDVPPGQMETRTVIDGQQRLTTLQLLLQAFEDVVGERAFESWHQARWTEVEIRGRSESLLRLACVIWPRPVRIAATEAA